MSDFLMRESQTDTNKRKRLSPQGGKSRLNESKRRTSVKEGHHAKISFGMKIQSSGDTSFTGTPLVDVANVVSLSVIPSISSTTPATSAKPAGELSRMSRKTIGSHRVSCTPKSFRRIPLKSRIEDGKVPENEIDLIVAGHCRKL